MMRSQVQGQSNGPGSVVSNTRTSKTGWLQDSFHPAISSLTRRVSDITGLNTDTFQDESELLQVRIPYCVVVPSVQIKCTSSSSSDLSTCHPCTQIGRHLTNALCTINFQVGPKNPKEKLGILFTFEHFTAIYCMKITQNVAFEFWHFPPILKLTCLVTLSDQ